MNLQNRWRMQPMPTAHFYNLWLKCCHSSWQCFSVVVRNDAPEIPSYLQRSEPPLCFRAFATRADALGREECTDYWMVFEKPLLPTNTRMKRWRHIREAKSVKSDGTSWTRRTRRRAPETFSSLIDYFKDCSEYKPPTCGRATSDQSKASVELQMPDAARSTRQSIDFSSLAGLNEPLKRQPV